MADLCPDCGKNLALVGRRHNCVPSAPQISIPVLIPAHPAKPTARVRGGVRIEDREKTYEATKPWLALGMSRRTWYRRQKERRTDEAPQRD